MCNRKETEIEVKICTSKSIKNEEQESASAAVVVAASAAVVVTSALAFVSVTNNAMVGKVLHKCLANFVSIWQCQVHKTAAAIAVPVAVDPFHCFHRHTLDYLFAILITVQVTSYELVSSGGVSDVGYKSIDFINAGINLQLHLKNRSVFQLEELQRWELYVKVNSSESILCTHERTNEFPTRIKEADVLLISSSKRAGKKYCRE
uniref:Uncharacterized protein n=1 Tax=Glossina austeni TaxID=7395 RepID=A0A1A9UEC1_GLOAU